MFLNTISILFFVGGISAQKTCAAAAKCSTPWPDLRDLMPCHLTSLFKPDGVTTINQLLAQQCCNGSTIEEVGKNFLSTISKGADGDAYKQITGVLPSFTLCLMNKGCSFEQAMTAIGNGFKKALGGMYNEVQTKVKSFRPAKCATQDNYNSFAKYTCKKINATTIQKVINSVKIEMGNAWSCIPNNLSPKILNMTKYKV